MKARHTRVEMLQSDNILAKEAQTLIAPRRPLRILQICPTYFPAVRYGGPIRSVHQLSAALVRRGHVVHVYTSSMDGPVDLQVPLDHPVTLDGVQIHYFRVPWMRRLCRAPAMQVALQGNVKGFDLVHLHSVFLWPTWTAARAARAAGVPYLISPRGMLGDAVIRGKNRLIKSLWIRLIERRTLRESAAVHVTADLEAQEIAALGLRTANTICIPNGVSWPAKHAPLASGPFAGICKPYALFLSRIDWKKGLDRLIAAWKWVPDLTLIIAGNDETGYRQRLEKIAAESAVSDRVRFIGPASDEHKWALYENAAMFILPSYSENFGNVVAEAMSMGCPVVVTPEVGLAELVRESGAGVVVEGTPRKLASAIRALQQDSAARRLMGERGRFAVRRHLSWESAAARMESAYADICHNSATSQPKAI